MNFDEFCEFSYSYTVTSFTFSNGKSISGILWVEFRLMHVSNIYPISYANPIISSETIGNLNIVYKMQFQEFYGIIYLGLLSKSKMFIC